MKGYRSEANTVLVSVLLFLVACALPALLFQTCNFKLENCRGTASLGGADILLVRGFFLLFFGYFWVLANFALWTSWVLLALRKYQAAYTASACALLCSVFVVQLVKGPITLNEAGTMGSLIAPQVGFFCWVASMLVIHIAAIRAQ